MRELKFRVWDGKEFTYSKDLTYIGLEEKGEKFKTFHQIGFLFCSQIVNHKNLENIIPQQFTGLKDKNGVEIYEGDIIKTKTLQFGTEFCDEIVFENGCFRLIEMGYNIDEVEGEVVSNIFEGAGDLLK